MEKVVIKGTVSKRYLKNRQYLALDMPHKPEAATLSFAVEAVLPIQEIFEPYIGKLISISITREKKEGKVLKVSIAEEKKLIRIAKSEQK